MPTSTEQNTAKVLGCHFQVTERLWLVACSPALRDASCQAVSCPEQQGTTSLASSHTTGLGGGPSPTAGLADTLGEAWDRGLTGLTQVPEHREPVITDLVAARWQ